MRRSPFRTWLACALALVVVAPAAIAQTTTGTLSGVVTDAEGSTALPGAVINAEHEPTGTTYDSVTRADGRFIIPNVRVGGPYRVTATMDGFQAQAVDSVYVQLGEDQNLTFRLQLDTVTETVIVVAESSPLINPSKTGASGQVAQEVLESLPSVTRSLEEYTRTNPFFAVSAENEDPEAISVAGRSGRYNNISIDGSVNNDLFGLAATGTPGGQSGTVPISIDAIQEIQLVVAPFDVRQGGFTGGGVNAVTRSGSNDWNGSVFYYTRDDSYFGDGPDELGELGEFEEDQYGFRLGGPIVRDKAFFFVNMDIEDATEPTGWSLDGSTGQTFGNGDLLDEAQRFRQISIDQYGFDPGGFAENAKDEPSDKYFARVDFNLSDRNNLTLRHNYVDAGADINRPSAFTYEFPSETYAFATETNSTVAQLNSVFGASTFNEARLAYQTIKDRRAPRGGVTFPWVEIENVGGREFEAGSEPFSTHNSLDQTIFEVHNDLTLLLGDHNITIGTHNEFFTFENLFIQNGFGSYEFANLDAYEAGTARRFNYSFTNPGQNPVAEFDVHQIGLYAGDQWRVSDRLTVNMGLRLDVPFLPDEPTRNPETEQVFGFRTDVMPDGELLWQPRVGFNWDVEGNGKAQLRGGAGIFAGRTPYVWISNQYTNNGIVFTNLQAFNVPFNPDPFNQPTNVGGATTQDVNLIDPDFEFPQIARYNLAYDRELPWWDLVGSAEIIYADSIKEIDYKNINLVQTGTSPVDGRPLYGGSVSGDFGGAYLITNTDEGSATNVAVKLERPYRDGVWGYVSYAHGESEVVNDGSSSRAVSNWQFNEAIDPNNSGTSVSDFEIEHRFNASLSYRFNRLTDYATTVSFFYNHQSGRPYSTIYGFQQFPSANLDRFFSNDLIYVPTGPDDVIINGGTWADLDAYISADPGLDAHRGQIVPRNASVAPWSHTFDLHVAQAIPIGWGTKAELTFDILNLANLIDEDSGVVRFAPFGALSPVGFGGIDAETGRYIYNLESEVTDPNGRFDIHGLTSRWRAKVGVRLSF